MIKSILLKVGLNEIKSKCTLEEFTEMSVDLLDRNNYGCGVIVGNKDKWRCEAYKEEEVLNEHGFVINTKIVDISSDLHFVEIRIINSNDKFLEAVSSFMISCHTFGFVVTILEIHEG